MLIPIKQGPKSVALNRVDAIEKVLTFLHLSENIEDDETKKDFAYIEPYCESREAFRCVQAFHKVPLTHFDGAAVDFLYESLAHTLSYDRLFVMPDDKELHKLPMPGWSHTMAGWYPDAANEYGEKYLFTMVRTRQIPLKAVRGMFRLRAAEVIDYAVAHLFNDGTYTSYREFWQFFAGAWHCVGIPLEVDPPHRLEDDSQHIAWMAKSQALTAEYDWSVHIGFNIASVPAVAIPSDPLSSKSIFKLRDVPPGKTRREALRNWVSGHKRAHPTQDEIEIQIYPYLRGAEEFTWNGLYCRIEPSKYDLRKALEYQKQAKAHA